ncbi:TetR/AcrR family transcriptional regulator [Microbacterium sp. ARD31]|uniref:TetR/AcrR family transcriptional regulator n=1 Tax=Microbacterium sp. ARD31 TaxID=2962576 RepID=UPI002880F0BF|nr:TetR/AcrR family transcriptional regulator [Microbacterium sp. ARD31]MDT0183999.1 TetR/AcrR family transcriptional regulator [Microbacterium sp. ARD31]
MPESMSPLPPGDGTSAAKESGRAARAAVVQRRAQARRTKSQDIALEAARALLVYSGSRSVTHAAVAEASGLGRTTIYRHWPEPADLLYDTIDNELPSTVLPHTGDVRVDLLMEMMQVRDRLQSVESSRLVMAIIERAVHDPVFASLRERWHRAGTEGTRIVLARARHEGIIHFPSDLQEGVEELAGPLIVRSVFAGRDVSADYVEHIVDRFLRRYRST